MSLAVKDMSADKGRRRLVNAKRDAGYHKPRPRRPRQFGCWVEALQLLRRSFRSA
jgi:hypothetical protein